MICKNLSKFVFQVAQTVQSSSVLTLKMSTITDLSFTPRTIVLISMLTSNQVIMSLLYRQSTLTVATTVLFCTACWVEMMITCSLQTGIQVRTWSLQSGKCSLQTGIQIRTWSLQSWKCSLQTGIQVSTWSLQSWKCSLQTGIQVSSWSLQSGKCSLQTGIQVSTWSLYHQFSVCNHKGSFVQVFMQESVFYYIYCCNQVQIHVSDDYKCRLKIT